VHQVVQIASGIVRISDKQSDMMDGPVFMVCTNVYKYCHLLNYCDELTVSL